MTPPHLANLAVHVAAGTLALVIGFMVLAARKGTGLHQRRGRRFCYLTLLVAVSAAIGLALFRFIPVFAALTILIPYQLVGGWRAAKTKAAGPGVIDAMLTLAAIALGVWVTGVVLAKGQTSQAVIWASFGALFTLIAYDLLKWLFPRRWFAVVWKYEHSYKLIASLFGMVSALLGNVLRFGQPWTQLAPSAVGFLVAVYFWYRIRVDAASGTKADGGVVDSLPNSPQGRSQ